MSFIGYHWHHIFDYCACAISRDLCVRSKFYQHIWNTQPWFAYSLCNFGGSTMKVIQVICQNNDWPCVDADLPYSTSKVEDLVTFMAIFSNIDMTIHCQIIAFLLLIRYVTLWPWPLTFWPWTVVTHGGSRDQPCRQVGHHWKCVCMQRLQPLCIYRITWSVSREVKTFTSLESPTPICLFTLQLLWGYDDD